MVVFPVGTLPVVVVVDVDVDDVDVEVEIVEVETVLVVEVERVVVVVVVVASVNVLYFFTENGAVSNSKLVVSLEKNGVPWLCPLLWNSQKHSPDVD